MLRFNSEMIYCILPSIQCIMCRQPNMNFIHNQRAYVFLCLTLGLCGARNYMECKTPDGAIKRAIRPNLCCKEDKICVKLVHQYSAWLINSDIMFAGAGVRGWYLLRILPPLFPFIGIVCSNGQVTNRGIKPHVEHLEKQNDSREWENIFFALLCVNYSGWQSQAEKDTKKDC